MDQNLSTSKTTQPVVTVVIPTFNEADNLAKITAALFALNLPDLRILIVDDNSPDGTGAVADGLVADFAAQDPLRVQVIHRTGKGGLGLSLIHI